MLFENFENFLLTEDCFNSHDVSHIDNDGNQHYLKHSEYIAYLGEVTVLLANRATIKVEQAEKLFEYNNGTIHIFYNDINGPSFEEHADPVDVLIECLDGTKIMEVDGTTVILQPNQSVLIPAGTKHRALNNKKALMISYGIHDTETLNGLREDDRDLQPRL
jgi:mannose-6-phosphate isomerase-like protein (cupin superfamily)